MANDNESHPIVGESDAHDRLMRADAPLLALQQACGGRLGGTIAIPQLLTVVARARQTGLTQREGISAYDGKNRVSAVARVTPAKEKARGTQIHLTEWNMVAAQSNGTDDDALTRRIARDFAECGIRLDNQQRIVSFEIEARDLTAFSQKAAAAIGRRWTEIVDLQAGTQLADEWQSFEGMKCRLSGSQRDWTIHIDPIGSSGADPVGLVLYLTSDTPLAEDNGGDDDDTYSPSLGRDLTPVLRQPVNRIIANAETIRTKLAGPLSDEYRTYADDIADAGQHLLGLMDDLSDLEVVEAETFTTAPDRIDLAEVARRACGILGVKAREKRITLVPPQESESQPAIAEFRRVLQILLNLIGNAIRYSPEDSQVWVRLDSEDARAMVTIADQGHGLDEDQQHRVFEKFERLGRSGDNGSGLGLYISRRIAHAMDGELTVESAPGQGARFTLSVPARK